ncbi:MAG TPA: lipopolysaccharide heptosyltransferase I [Pyrinomonadaceae bacterium]
MRVLFVKLGAIGDIVHALPALAAARRAMPDATIDWVVERRSAEILRGSPAIDELIEVDTRAIRDIRSPDRILSAIKTQAASIRGREYDVALDLQGLWKSAMIAKVSGARRRVGFGREGLREPAARVLYNEKIDIEPRINVIEKNLALVRSALELADDGVELEFPIDTRPEHRMEADSIAGKAGRKFALLNPAGGWVTKLWRAEDYGKLAGRLAREAGLDPIIVSGPGEEDLAARAIDAAGGVDVIRAEPSLKGFFELAKRAAVYVGGDTGPTHIAVAAGAPVVGIYGPTEWWRNGSPREEDICVGREDISCRVDCHRRTCSKWICMDINVETVFEAVVQRMKRARSGTKEAAVL